MSVPRRPFARKILGPRTSTRHSQEGYIMPEHMCGHSLFSERWTLAPCDGHVFSEQVFDSITA
jgi:hypothetical protein